MYGGGRESEREAGVLPGLLAGLDGVLMCRCCKPSLAYSYCLLLDLACWLGVSLGERRMCFEKGWEGGDRG